MSFCSAEGKNFCSHVAEEEPFTPLDLTIFSILFLLGSGERERDDLRNERHRDRARQRNIDRAAPERQAKLGRGRERDVSEQIALGIPAKAAGASGEGLFDSRLFNQSRGLGSGYGDDEGYNVYSEPWRKESNLASNIYRPGKNIDKEAYGGQEDLDELRKTNR